MTRVMLAENEPSPIADVACESAGFGGSNARLGKIKIPGTVGGPPSLAGRDASSPGSLGAASPGEL